MNRHFALLAVGFTIFLLGRTAFGEPTAVDVRVIAKGSKFIGTSMGGAEVTIRDAKTGQLLARGKTQGSTGDTDKLMTEKAVHHAPVSTDDSAVFRAVVELDEPRQLKVTARGPLGQRQAQNTASVTQWVVPGKPVIGGDGLVLELPGFVVDVLAPPAHQKLSREAARSLALEANVSMMCGCPITPGGLWDAEQFEVAGIIRRDGKKVDTVPLEYAGETSRFEAVLKLDRAGVYEVTVFAYDPENGNTGVDTTTFIVSE